MTGLRGDLDSAELPFGDGAFTAVMSTSSFHHYPEPERVLAEFRRVLLPGGRLALGDLSSDRLVMRGVDRLCIRLEDGHVHFNTSHELASLLNAAGFAEVRAQPLLAGCFALATARYQ